MPTINIDSFSGIKPIFSPLLLRQNEATVANNVRLNSGAIEPLLGTTTLKALTKTAPKTIFRYGNSSVETEYWMEFTDHVDVMRSPILDNQYGLVYWTDGVLPKYAQNSQVLTGNSYPGASYTLGIPAPINTPQISGSAPAAASKSETRSYTYTYVSAFGEEGPPAPACAAQTLDPSAAVAISNMSTVPTGNYNITLKRIYRSSTVNNIAQFQFVAEIPVAQTTYSDTISQAALGEVLPSDLWAPPPAGLTGLKSMPNGIAIGVYQNTVYLSEPNLPHAWPNQYPVDYQCIGIGVYGQTAIVLTSGYPYALSGPDPQSMSLEKLQLPQACLTKESIVDMQDGILYASPDGLVSIGAKGIKIVTADLLSRSQWQSYNPSSIVAEVYDSKYVATFQRANGTRGIIIFDFTGNGATFTSCDLNSSSAVTAMYSDPRSDILYLAQGTNIVRFDSGSAMSYAWKSKTFRVPFPINFGVGQVIADIYPVTINVYADGVLVCTKSVADGNVFRLPSGFRAVDWQMELVGSARVTQMLLSTSVAEVRQA